MVYSEEMGRWLGKNGKFYDFKFNGNQYTGGRLKFAKNLSRKLDKTSKIIGGVQIGLSWNEYLQGNYTLAQNLMDTGFGVFGILNKTYETWTGIWYELGKEYGLIHKYMKHKNVE